MKYLIAAAGLGLMSLIGVAALYATGDGVPAAAAPASGTAQVVRRAVTRTATFQGSVEYGAQIEIAAPRDGLLAEVPVRVGQRVAAGQLLARFDGSGLALERDELARESSRHANWLAQVYPAQRRSLDSAGRALDLKLRQEVGALAAKLRATREARSEGIATPADVAAAERELGNATARANGERAAHAAQISALGQQRLEAELGRSSAGGKGRSLSGGAATGSLRAPFPATVAAVSIQPYGPTRVAAGTHLVTLVDTASFTLAVPVPPSEIARLSQSAPVSCFLPRRGRSVPCRLLGIVKGEQGYVARFSLSGLGDLERGEAGDVRLNEIGPRDSLTVPQAALSRNGDTVGVRVLRGGQAAFVPVAVRFFGEAEVAVSGDLRPGERVLLD
ncbi:MAG TPA: HlyD family efflux transporter periplasmic adaptor subunit [Allosphingosinicella sp.]|nr:HlyD family efflux transporter periplasmic adaptor subunit [Allosphingosinicella sp.]